MTGKNKVEKKRITTSKALIPLCHSSSNLRDERRHEEKWQILLKIRSLSAFYFLCRILDNLKKNTLINSNFCFRLENSWHSKLTMKSVFATALMYKAFSRVYPSSFSLKVS